VIYSIIERLALEKDACSEFFFFPGSTASTTDASNNNSSPTRTAGTYIASNNSSPTTTASNYIASNNTPAEGVGDKSDSAGKSIPLQQADHHRSDSTIQ
jgi:hypothetical protein